MSRKRRNLRAIENGARPGMVAVTAAMLYKKEIPGVFTASGKLILGKIEDGKFVLRPLDRFYHVILWYRINLHRFKNLGGVAIQTVKGVFIKC